MAEIVAASPSLTYEKHVLRCIFRKAFLESGRSKKENKTSAVALGNLQTTTISCKTKGAT